MPRFQINSRPTDRRDFWNWSGNLLAVYGAAVLVLASLMMRFPALTEWVSEALQAEAYVMSPAPQDTPTQLAQPSDQMRTVRAY
jgi:hypothetical protein